MASRSPEVNDGLPRGRNAAQTQARILAAAQRIFSTSGYAHAGLRDIAADAEVNVALVARYFGSKEKLFEAALEASITTGKLWVYPRATFGTRVVALFVDAPSDTPNPLPMLVHAASDPVAQAVALRLIQERIVAPLAEWLGPPNGETRAAEILAVCAGFFTYRTLLPLAQFTGAMEPGARRWLEARLQDIVDCA